MKLEQFEKLIAAHREFYVSESASGYRHPVCKFEQALDIDDSGNEWSIYKQSKFGWSYSGHLSRGELFGFIGGMEVWVKYE